MLSVIAVPSVLSCRVDGEHVDRLLVPRGAGAPDARRGILANTQEFVHSVCRSSRDGTRSARTVAASPRREEACAAAV